MKLLTLDLARTIPAIGSQESVADPVVVAKFFTPDSSWTWFVLEGSTAEREGCGFGVNCNHRPLADFDPERDDALFFGLVDGFEAELGYFRLSELEGVRGPMGLPIERDLYWTPKPLSEVRR